MKHCTKLRALLHGVPTAWFSKTGNCVSNHMYIIILVLNLASCFPDFWKRQRFHIGTVGLAGIFMKEWNNGAKCFGSDG